MKKLKLYITSLILAVAATGCGEDYLNTTPESTTTEENLFSSPKTAQYAVNGLSSMWYSIKYIDDQMLFGLPAVFLWNNEFTGNGLQIMNYTGYKNTANGNYNNADANKNVRFPWYLFYKVIANCNTILSKIPESAGAGEQQDWDYIKAQTLTFRAYCYHMLTNYYCRRWSDKNGQSRGLVLRLEPTDEPMAPCTLAEVYAQVYKDLDDALELFASCGKTRPEGSRWMADANVAHAIYSRAALYRQDWQTSVNHAKEARKGYPLMTAEDYMKGFNTANREWIWEIYEDETRSAGYASFFGYASPANSTSFLRSRVPIISKELVNAIDPADSRLEIYCIPTTKELSATSAAKITNSGSVTKGTFYTRIKTDYVASGRVSEEVPIAYYMATKFIKTGGIADGSLPIFRSAEMYYNEIEAQIKLGNETAAQQLLEEVVAPYNAGYTCTKTGDALWDEYVAYRHFDLWGEGHNWPDNKRWGGALIRNAWKDGGNWNDSFVCGESDYGPTDKYNWTIVIPKFETQYNDKIATFESDDWKPGDR